MLFYQLIFCASILNQIRKVISLYCWKLSQGIQTSLCLFLGIDRGVNLAFCLNFQQMGNPQFITLHAAIRSFIVLSNFGCHVHKKHISITDLQNYCIFNHSTESAISMHLFLFPSHFLNK